MFLRVLTRPGGYASARVVDALALLASRTMAARPASSKGYVFARRAQQASDRRLRTWFIGYTNDRRNPFRNLETIDIIHQVDVTQSADGPVLTVKTECPDCYCQGDPCVQCGGDGKFHQDRKGDYVEGAMSDLTEASDEEPVGVLVRFTAASK